MKRSILEEILIGCAPAFFGFLLGLLFCILFTLAGCKPQRIVERIEVPVVTTQEHTIEKVKVEQVHDTLLQRDSIYHFVKGDTVLIEKWHYSHNTAEKIRTDTVFETDSIEVPKVVTKTVHDIQEVEKPLQWWQKTLMFVGGCAIFILIIFWFLRKKH